MADDIDGHWITLESGTHVFIDGSGNVIKGPSGLTGKPLKVPSTQNNEAKTTPESPSTDQVRSTPEEMSAADDYKKNGIKSKAFKSWFGDWETDPANASKIVNDKGEPQETSGEPVMVYHGTPKTFDEFSVDKTGSNIDAGFLGQGFYFTSNPEVAKYYSKPSVSKDAHTINAYLKAKNPFNWGAKTLGSRGLVLRGDRLPEAIHDKVIARTGFKYDPDAEPNFGDEKLISEAIRKELIEQGYDGVVSDVPAGKQYGAGKEYVVFDPEQIKSVDNEGTFDPSNPKFQKAMSYLSGRHGESLMQSKQKAHNKLGDRWVTLENGVHVLISASGNVLNGPAGLVGKPLQAPHTENNQRTTIPEPPKVPDKKVPKPKAEKPKNSKYKPKQSPDYYGPTSGGVSEEAHYFISDWQDSPTTQPSDSVIEELGKYVPDKAVVLYRGGKSGGKEPLKSWSYDKEVAEGFVEPGESLTKRTWYPDEVLIDFTKLPDAYKADLEANGMGNSLSEVVVAYGDMAKKIKQIRNTSKKETAKPAAQAEPEQAKLPGAGKPMTPEQAKQALAPYDPSKDKPLPNRPEIKQSLESVVNDHLKTGDPGVFFDTVYKELKEQHPEVTPQEFKAIVNDLFQNRETGQFTLGKWPKTLSDVPLKEVIYKTPDSDADSPYYYYIRPTANYTAKSLTIEQKNLGPHKYGCLMGRLPDVIAKQITDWAIENILECHLDPIERLEVLPHVTILYGFTGTTEEVLPDLTAMLIRHGPIHVRLGQLSLFTGGNNGSVLKVDVDSLELHDLHNAIAESFPHYDKYDYRPHVTVGYLLPDVAPYYATMLSPFAGLSFTIDTVEWSSADNERELIPLSFANGFPVASQKVMSYLSETSGGALVAPVDQPKSLIFDPEGIKLLRQKYKRRKSPVRNEYAEKLTNTHLVGITEKSFQHVRINSQIRNKAWVTIGGHAEGDKQHVGGTAVEIDGEGKITKGPPKLTGQNVNKIGKTPKAPKVEKKPAAKKPKVPKAENSEVEKAPEQPKVPEKQIEKPKEKWKSKAKVSFATKDDKAKAKKAWSHVVGNKLPIEDAGTLVGAPDDAEITVSGATYEASKTIVIIRMHGKPSSKGGYEYKAVRMVYLDEKTGKPYIYNNTFEVKEKGKGLGAEIFANQVKAAAKLGIESIRCMAAGNYEQASDGGYNGYYTWPRFGYDQDLSKFDEVYNKWFGDKVKKQFPKAKTVLDIMSTPKGREWWKQNGIDLDHAKFDLNPNSRSMKVLNAYLEAKKST